MQIVNDKQNSIYRYKGESIVHNAPERVKYLDQNT